MTPARYARMVRAVTGWSVSRQKLAALSPRKQGAITRRRPLLRLVDGAVRMDWRIARQARAVAYASPRRFWRAWRWMR